MGRMADVGFGRTGVGRLGELHCRTDHFVGHLARDHSQNFRAPFCPANV